MVSEAVTFDLIDRYQITRRHMPHNRTPDTHYCDSVVSQSVSYENYVFCNIWEVTRLFCLVTLKPQNVRGNELSEKYIFLNAFETLRRPIINFVMCLSTWKNSVPFDGFSWNLTFENFSKISPKIQVLIKCDKDNRYLTGRRYYFANFFLAWEMFQTKVAEKIETHILCSVTFFSKILPFMR
jgi:hypothetical protein